MKARDNVALAPYPFHVVRGRAFHCRIEERLAEAPYIDDHGKVTFNGHGPQTRPQLPRYLRIEVRKYQLALLPSDLFQVFVPSHADASFHVSAIVHAEPNLAKSNQT
jgi:hypothetical protein